MHGAVAFREQLEEKLALARLAADRLRGMEGIEMLAEPQLSVLAFRLAPAGMSESELEELNQRFRERINARQPVLLAPPRLRGKFALRICVLSFRTHRERIEMALEDIEAARRGGLGEALITAALFSQPSTNPSGEKREKNKNPSS